MVLPSAHASTWVGVLAVTSDRSCVAAPAGGALAEATNDLSEPEFAPSALSAAFIAGPVFMAMPGPGVGVGVGVGAGAGEVPPPVAGVIVPVLELPLPPLIP